MNNIKNIIDYIIDPYVDTVKCLVRDTRRHEDNVQISKIADKRKSDWQAIHTTYEFDKNLHIGTHYTTLTIGVVAIARTVSLIAATIFASLTIAAFACTSGFTAFVLTAPLAISTLVLHDVYQIATNGQRVLTSAELAKLVWGITQDLFALARPLLQEAYETSSYHPKDIYQKISVKMQHQFEERGVEAISWVTIKNAAKSIEQNTILIHAIYRTITSPFVEKKIIDGIHRIKNNG